MRTKEQNRLIFDIETTAMEGVEEWLPEPKVDSRIKDEAKIANAREEKRAEMIERAPLDADLATVRAISMRITTTGQPLVYLVPGPNTPKMKKSKKVDGYLTLAQEVGDVAMDIIGRKVFERAFPMGLTLKYLPEPEAVRGFWQQLLMCNGANVGFNQLGFDLPFLLRRSMDLGVEPGIIPAMAKYRDHPTTDLFGLLNNWAWGETKKLKWLARRYGLEPLVDEAEFNGASVAGMSDAELVAYALSDLHVTTNLYRRMNGYYFSHMEVGY